MLVSVVGGGVEDSVVVVSVWVWVTLSLLELLLLDELDCVVVLDCVVGAVVTLVGLPPLTLPAGGSGAIGWPSSASRMKSVQILTGTVPPVSSPTPGMAFIWFSGTREPSPL